MAMLVVNGALLQCSFGMTPASLLVPDPSKTGTSMPIASIMNNIPMLNIPTFGMCSTLSNPTVAAATAAALGVLTPMPCIPATVAPWAPGSLKTCLGPFPALSDSSKLICMWGGVITIAVAGQLKATLR